MQYVYVVHRTEDGKTATVLAHCQTRDQAHRKTVLMDGGGYDGPLPADRYPVGSTLTLDE